MGAALSTEAPGGGESARRAALEALADTIRADLPTVPEITAADLARALDSSSSNGASASAPPSSQPQAQPQEVVVVDCRTPEERAVSELPAPAVVLGADEFDRDRARWAGRRVVCMCTAGKRSGMLALRLRAAGVDAANLRGGILAWTHERRPLREPATGAETRRVHVYAPRWALQADGYAPVAFRRPLLAGLQEAVGRRSGSAAAKGSTVDVRMP